mmetsp:Transcript_9257/g.15160  ORF Transcript_9257/g.15160 Transcript_9257/m.15160 type:complete len:254 (-) Transcript_9257:109-870(-)
MAAACSSFTSPCATGASSPIAPIMPAIAAMFSSPGGLKLGICIGICMPSMPCMLCIPCMDIPCMPCMPGIPCIPGMPGIPCMPGIHCMPGIPCMLCIPGMPPNIPGMPPFIAIMGFMPFIPFIPAACIPFIPAAPKPCIIMPSPKKPCGVIPCCAHMLPPCMPAHAPLAKLSCDCGISMAVAGFGRFLPAASFLKAAGTPELLSGASSCCLFFMKAAGTFVAPPLLSPDSCAIECRGLARKLSHEATSVGDKY